MRCGPALARLNGLDSAARPSEGEAPSKTPVFCLPIPRDLPIFTDPGFRCGTIVRTFDLEVGFEIR